MASSSTGAGSTATSRSEAAAAAARLATANALASACAVAGGRLRMRRCRAVTCFVDATPEALEHLGVSPPDGGAGGSPAHSLRAALGLTTDVLGCGPSPLVRVRPAAGLAGSMPVEVELLLELGVRAEAGRRADGCDERRRVRTPGGRAGARERRRSASRTSSEAWPGGPDGTGTARREGGPPRGGLPLPPPG